MPVMRVIIVGGGFCGALVAKKLGRRKDMEVLLFDKKDYFEFTPGDHKLLFSPKHAKKIRSSYNSFIGNTKLITDEVVRITPGKVETAFEQYSYDYLIISTGVEYPIRLDNKENIYTWADRESLSDRVKLADSLLIIGGGLIGVELAGELVTKSQKKVTIVHPRDRLLERNPDKACRYARKFLEKHHATLIFGEKVVEHVGNTFITDKGTKVNADMALWCAGIKANPNYMEGFPKGIFSERNALQVNEFLQLEGFPNIFVGGDINSVPEEKTAQNAERHGSLIVKNLFLQMKNKPLIPHKPRSAPLVISLGDWKAIMTLPNGWVINGLFPGMLKHSIEWWAMQTFK